MKYQILTTSLLLSTGLHAATLPTVVVSAARSHEPGIETPASTLVIGREEIRRSGARNLSELLRGRAGIHVSDLFGDGSAATLDMRGFGGAAASNTLLIVDGHRMNPASDSAGLYLNRIDLAQVEQIEILQGSAGVLYGNQAVGGVIHVITARPEGFEASVRTTAGSFGHRALGLSIGDRADNGLGYRVDAKRRTTDNHRDHNASTLENLALHLDYEQGEDRVWLSYENLNEAVDTPGALFLEEIAADREQAAYIGDNIDTDSESWRAGLRRTLNPNWHFEAELAYSDDDRDFIQSFRTFAGTPSTQDRLTWEFSPRLVGRLGTDQAPTHITFGVDLRNTDYLLVGFGPQSVDQTTTAVYGQVITALDERTDISLGLRHAQVRNDLYFEDFSVFPSALTSMDINDRATAGSLGLVHEAAPGWEVFARANQNYRFAKVDEHTNNVFGQPVGLDTQTGITYEIGTRYKGPGLAADLVLYRLDLNDEIHYDANQFSNVNIDGTRRVGLLASIDHEIDRRLSIGGSYNYVDSEITAGPFNGRSVPLVPEHKARLYGTYRPGETTMIQLEGLYVSSQGYGGDYANRFPRMDSYAVLNLTASHERGPWRTELRVDNLTDEDYSESGNIGYDSTAHADCIADGFGGFNCPAENPSPGIKATLTIEYRLD